MLMSQGEVHAHAATSAPRRGLIDPPPAGLRCGEWQPLLFMGDCATAQASAWGHVWTEDDDAVWCASFEAARELAL